MSPLYKNIYQQETPSMSLRAQTKHRAEVQIRGSIKRRVLPNSIADTGVKARD